MNGRRLGIEPSGRGPEPLLFGIGNSGRGDDGLGWAFLDRIQQDATFRGRVEYRYQLQVEDAVLVSRAQHVVFVDAYRGALPGGFRWQSCEPSRDFEFTTHVLPPAAVLYLSRDLYDTSPGANLLLIRGSGWDLGEGLSSEAQGNLDRALRFFKTVVNP